ncbi:MAG: hypothetical protein AAFU72_07830 [Pseudomonadota bacterium]
MKDFEDDDRSAGTGDDVEAPKRSFLASPILWLSSIAFWVVIAYLLL